MANITAFEIHGLFDSRDVRFELGGPALIIVGPNGLGKSNAAIIYYLFSTRQWSRLLEHSFQSIVAEFGTVRHTLTRQDISGINDLSELLNERRLPPSFRNHLSILQSANKLERFLEFKDITAVERREMASMLGMPTGELGRFRSYVKNRFLNDEFRSPSAAAISELLSEKNDSRIIYLPTYRRIEKDLKQIFPDLEERMRFTEKSSKANNIDKNNM